MWFEYLPSREEIPAICIRRRVSRDALSLSGQLKLHALLQPILDPLTRRTALTEKVFKDNILFGVPQMPKKSNKSILIQQQGFLQGREN
jgi:hypothetical protein